MTRRTFATGIAAGAGTALSAVGAGSPNILFICSDQHSGRVLGAAGHPVVRTPNLDRLAARGVLFRNAYTAQPVCVPGRAAMMTGRFASDVNSYCNSTPLGREETWGNWLARAGYDCWASGKLDLTEGADYGFHEVDTDHGHSRKPDITSLFRAPVCFRRDERPQIDGEFRDRADSDAALAGRAIEFIRGRSGSKPWAAYAGMHQPHPKWVAQARYREMYPPERMPLPRIPPGYLEARPVPFQILAGSKNLQLPVPDERVRRARSAYFGCISELDENVGRILDEIDRAGLWDRTLVVYTSDHGEMLGEHGLWLKNVLLENAARVPLILAGAGLPRGKVIEAPVSHVDMVASILDLARVARPDKLRGRSLVPLANGGAGPAFVFGESHSEGNCTGSFMVRKNDWKYIYFTGDAPLLFGLKSDPGELRNLAGRPETAAIQMELHQTLQSVVDPDAVTARAFAEQRRRLDAMVGRLKADEFYNELLGRLGPAQARVLTDTHYRAAKA